MGNTLTTQASTHPAETTMTITATATPTTASKRNHHHSDSRPSTAGFSPTGHGSLKKMESSSTLSSLAKFYNHSNPSNASMSSKISKSSGWRKQQAEKVLDIGKPTQFEHGIHVEYNKDNGRYMVRCFFFLSQEKRESLIFVR